MMSAVFCSDPVSSSKINTVPVPWYAKWPTDIVSRIMGSWLTYFELLQFNQLEIIVSTPVVT